MMSLIVKVTLERYNIWRDPENLTTKSRSKTFRKKLLKAMKYPEGSLPKCMISQQTGSTSSHVIAAHIIPAGCKLIDIDFI